jgi:hypothetical protein
MSDAVVIDLVYQRQLRGFALMVSLYRGCIDTAKAQHRAGMITAGTLDVRLCAAVNALLTIRTEVEDLRPTYAD